MDEHLRALYRLAAAGDLEARARLDARLRLLGSAGDEFRAPRVVPELPVEWDDPILYEGPPGSLLGWTPAGRRFARAHGHRRNRRHVKHALRGGGRGRPPDEDLDDL